MEWTNGTGEEERRRDGVSSGEVGFKAENGGFYEMKGEDGRRERAVCPVLRCF